MSQFLSRIILPLLLLTGCTASHMEIFPDLEDPSLMDRPLSVAQMHEDIDAFVDGVWLRHPDLSQYADRAAIENAAAHYKTMIETPMVRSEFYRVVGQLSHLFNDGHVFMLWPYPELQRAEAAGVKGFPFEIVLTPNEQVLIKHQYTSGNQTLHAGSRLRAVNGQPVEAIFSHLQRFVGGESEYLRKQIVARRFARMLTAVFDWQNDFELVLERNNLVETLLVDVEQQWDETSKREGAEHYFKVLQTGVGMLYLGHFDIDPSEFEDFIDDSFAQIRANKIATLIIDIRDNPGGNTDTVTYLAQHLADKPFRLVSAVREKLNPDNRGWFNYKGQVGEVLSQDWTDWKSPVSEQTRFTGETYLLIGPASYSAAIVLATTLKDNQFATLVGEVTGGYANQTGQGNLFNLPHSQLRSFVATRSLVRPSGNLESTGVQPHFEAINDTEDVKHNRDAAVAFVLNQAQK